MNPVDLYKQLCVANGYSLVPLYSYNTEKKLCGCGLEDCERPGKHPLKKWRTENLKVKENELDYYMNLLSKTVYNLGIVCGDSLNDDNKSKLIVIDFDNLEEEKELIEKFKKEETCSVLTGKGIHFFFYGKLNSQIRFKNRSIDVISDKRYVVGPGSIHKTGSVYTWNGLFPKELPEWAKEEFKQKKKSEKSSVKISIKPNGLKTDRAHFGEFKSGKIPIGKRNDTLFKVLITLARKTNFSKSALELAAKKCWSNMEDPESFQLSEIQKTINSVLSYKERDTLNVIPNQKFSLGNSSAMWVKRLNNLGVLSLPDIKENGLIEEFTRFEEKVLELSIIKKPLSETFLGHTISEFINHRNELMSSFFDGIPFWNYLNIEYQNWATVFSEKQFERRKYRGVKYFGKGNSNKEKIGFGFQLLPKEAVLPLLAKEFYRLKNIIKIATLNKYLPIKKFDKKIDAKIANYFGITDESHIEKLCTATKENPLNWAMFKKYGFKAIKPGGLTFRVVETTTQATALSLACRPTIGREESVKKMTGKIKNNIPKKLVSETKVKITVNEAHKTKYVGIPSIPYTDAELEYSWTHSEVEDAIENGILTSKEKVNEFLSTLKENDIVGIGYRTYIFDQVFDKDEIVAFYSNPVIKDGVLDSKYEKRTTNIVEFTFAQINKYLDMGFAEILYRNGEVYGLPEDKKYYNYRVFEIDKEKLKEMEEEAARQEASSLEETENKEESIEGAI